MHNKYLKYGFVVIFLIISMPNLYSCYPFSWNKRNTQLSFIPQVADRIGACEKPVNLTPQETNALTASLSGSVKDLFEDSEMSDNVLAYYEETTKGINQNNFAFVRMSKNGQRYIQLIYTKTGYLFGAGQGWTRELSKFWFKNADCPQ